jgi:hypothetical protein
MSKRDVLEAVTFCMHVKIMVSWYITLDRENGNAYKEDMDYTCVCVCVCVCQIKYTDLQIYEEEESNWVQGKLGVEGMYI